MTADGVIVRHTVSTQPNPDAAPATQRLYRVSIINNHFSVIFIDLIPFRFHLAERVS